ncbi:MAG TPA: hypothetical protein VEZ89_18795, partial [Rubrivivax sp.]|nr:hypothetical protein [Rubrivivax sp.]
MSAPGRPEHEYPDADGGTASASASPAAAAPAPRRGRAFALGALAVLLVLVLAAGGFVVWLWHSESGTRWVLQRVPGLQVQGVQGRLLGGPFQASRLQWQGSGWRIVVEDLAWRDSDWRWRPSPGAWVGVELTALRARSVVATPPEETAKEPAPEPPANLKLPLELVAQGLQVGTLRLGETASVTGLAADVHLGAAQGSEHRVERLALGFGDLLARGQARIGTAGEMAVQAQLGLSSKQGAARPWQAQSTLAGPLPRLAAQATLSVPPGARVDATAVLTPFAPFPLAALNLRTKALDLSAIEPSLPQTSLSGQAVLRETQPGSPLAFDVQFANALPGPWDAERLPVRSARALLRGSPAEPTTLTFEALEAELGGERGGGRILGGGRWTEGTLVLDLRLEDLQPARLDTRAPALQLSGPLAVTVRGLPAPGAAAASPGLTGEVTTTLEGGSLQRRAPRATLQAEASFALPGDGSTQVSVKQLRVASGDATASASADTRRGPDGAWQLATSGELSRFDPGAWWPAAAARGNALNGSWQADLRGSGAAAKPFLDTLRGEASFDLAASRYAGLPLQGRATLRARDDALRLHAELQAAGNQLRAEGNAGVAGRTPRWRLDIDAPALGALAPLAALAPGVAPWIPSAGTLQAQAETEGRWPRLASRGTLRAAGLRTKDLQLARADAKWSLGGTGLDAPLSLELDAEGLAQGERRLDTLQVRAEGTLRAHRATLTASSPLRPPAWTDMLAPSVVATGTRPANGRAAATVGSVLRVALQGRWQPGAGQGGRWQGSFSELRAAPRNRPDTPWMAATDLQLAVDLAPEGGLRSATLAPGRVALFGGGVRWSQAQWQSAPPGGLARFTVNAEVEPLQVAPLLAQLQPELAWQGDLALGARVQVAAANAFDADVVVTRQGGDLSLAYQGVRRALGIQELRLVLAAHGGRWQLTQAVSARNVGVLGGGFSVMAAPSARWPGAAAPIDGGLSLRIDDLGVWAPWLPA